MCLPEKYARIVLAINLLKVLVRSSRPDVFCKNDVLRNFAKFTGKHMFLRLFFNKA